MKFMYLALFILGTFFLNGCATIGEALNPYKSEFTCPQREKGKCAPISQTYEESIKDSDKKKKKEVEKQKDRDAEVKNWSYWSHMEEKYNNNYSFEHTENYFVESEDVTKNIEENIEKEKTAFSIYEDEVFKKMASLLRDPTTPLVAPPHVMRVLFLSYKGESNELFMPRFVYFFADEPRWIMGDYIIGKETE